MAKIAHTPYKLKPYGARPAELCALFTWRASSFTVFLSICTSSNKGPSVSIATDADGALLDYTLRTAMQSAESLGQRSGVAPGLLLKMLPRPGPLLKEACVRRAKPGSAPARLRVGDSRGCPTSRLSQPWAAGHPLRSLGLLMPWACSWGPLPTEAFASSSHLCPHPCRPHCLPVHAGPHSRPCLLRVLQTHPNPSTNHTHPLMHSLCSPPGRCCLDQSRSSHLTLPTGPAPAGA